MAVVIFMLRKASAKAASKLAGHSEDNPLGDGGEVEALL